MVSYLDEYGVDDARRERLIKRVAAAVLSLVLVGATLYFVFRNFREERQIKTFLSLLVSRDYQAAYRLWGCTAATPCRDYPFEKFLEDWGPQSRFANAAAAKVVSARSCATGLIQTLSVNGDEVRLWVERRDQTLAFAPWPVCSPRMAAP